MIKPFRILDDVLIPAIHNVVIHCDTKEKSEYLLRHLHTLDYEWESGDCLLQDFGHYYGSYGHNTCYRINNEDKIVTYGEVISYSTDGYTIYEFEEACGCSLDEAMMVEDLLDTTDFRILDILIDAQNGKGYKTIVHCKTREESNKLLHHLASLNYSWLSGHAFGELDYYNVHKENTIYMIYYDKNEGKVIQFGNIIKDVDEGSTIDKEKNIVVTFEQIAGTR